MRSFHDIQRDLGLVLYADSPLGRVTASPSHERGERLLVRHLDGEIPPALLDAWIDLASTAAAWVAADPALARVLRVEQPVERGRDFLATRHIIGTSLRRFVERKPWPPPERDPRDAADLDDDEPPPAIEPPDELGPMLERFPVHARTARSSRERLVVELLTRAVLAPAIHTIYDYQDSRFVVADLEPTRAELERWAELMRS
jgi:hypothetical protein